MPLNKTEIRVLRSIIEALDVPRNKFGALDAHFASGDSLRKELQRFRSEGFPVAHGGLDRVDQVVMALQCLLGDTPVSIQDRGITTLGAG